MQETCVTDDELAKFAATAGVTLDEFRREFEYLVATEPPPVTFEVDAGKSAR